MGESRIEDILEAIKPLSDEEKVAYLFDIIHSEASKPMDEMDQELVARCSEYASQYNQNVVPTLTDEEVEERLTALKQRQHKQDNKPRRAVTLRKTAVVIAAVVLVSLLTLTVVARSSGFQSVGDFVVYAMDNLFSGGAVDEDRITYVYGGKAVTYGSLEEWKSQEGFDMLCPMTLPEGVAVEKISMFQDENGTDIFVFHFNVKTISFTVKNQIFDFNVENATTYITASGLTFSIVRDQQAVCQTGTYEYTIVSENADWLTIMMEGMK